jgi:hypothetical protein
MGLGMGAALLSAGTGIMSSMAQQDAVNSANETAQQQALFQSMNDTMTANQQSYWAMEQANRAEDSAMKSAENDYKLLNEQEDQINSDAVTKSFERLRQGLRERSKVMVAAAESGAMGQSEQTGEANVLFQTSYDQALIEQERQDKVAYSEAQKDANSLKLRDRLNDSDTMRLQSKIIKDTAVTTGLQRLANVKTYSNVNPFVEALKIGGSSFSTGMSTYSSSKIATKV